VNPGIAGHHHRCERWPEAGRGLRPGSAAALPDGVARAALAGCAGISRQRPASHPGQVAPSGGPVGPSS